MKQVDLEPGRHSHLYEIKPLSRWWFVAAIALFCFAAFWSGLTRPETWLVGLTAAFVCAFALLCFPRYWLSKIND